MKPECSPPRPQASSAKCYNQYFEVFIRVQVICCFNKSSLTVSIVLRVLSYPFFKFKITLADPKTLIVVSLIII